MTMPVKEYWAKSVLLMLGFQMLRGRAKTFTAIDLDLIKGNS